MLEEMERQKQEQEEEEMRKRVSDIWLVGGDCFGQETSL